MKVSIKLIGSKECYLLLEGPTEYDLVKISKKKAKQLVKKLKLKVDTNEGSFD